MSLDCKSNQTFAKAGKILLPLLTVCWMAVIFWFSAAPAPESSEMSYTVGIQIGKVVVSDFDAWSTEKQNAFAEKIEYPIRKTAHATEYAILGILVSGTFYVYGICEHGIGRKKMLCYAWLLATAYAATDEFHQLFVPGRSGQVRDVILDSAGALAGALILCGVRQLWQKRG